MDGWLGGGAGGGGVEDIAAQSTSGFPMLDKLYEEKLRTIVSGVTSLERIVYICFIFGWLCEGSSAAQRS